jgi:hypothetical protein
MAIRETLAGIVTRGKLQGAIVLVAAALLGASGASAQEYRGTAEQQQACMGDVFRLCWSEIPDVGRIVGCLKRERPRLSEGCRAVFGGASTRFASRRSRHHQHAGTSGYESTRYSSHSGYQGYQGRYQNWY